ncbi:toprim domain-containing protein [Cupriavidus sp. TMH.W2]|uniref:toprim domain-containing protein n=1 Tax=Cupriavidus sp. TMH.W2 TaxID=3434465 RepID=UPI003D76E11C
MKTLVLVEASGKTDLLARRLRDLRYTVQVLATVGHLCDNPRSLRPIALDAQLRELAYGLREDRAALLEKIRGAAMAADQIFLAMDDDQEGDVIAHDVAGLLSGERGKMARVRLGSLDESDLRWAFERATPLDAADARPGMCRRIIDRAIGSAFSVIAEGATIPVGRVQSGILDAIHAQAPQVGVYRLALPVKDGRVFMAEVPVHGPEDVAACGRLATAIAQGSIELREQSEVELPVSTPWAYEEVVEQIALRLRIDIDPAAKALQDAYERGLVTYPRARAQAFAPEGAALGVVLAENNRCAYDAGRVPVRDRMTAVGKPHESPRPLDAEGDAAIGRSLSLMGPAEAVHVLLARNLIECGQRVRQQRARVAVDERELMFCYTARAPMRSWKDKPAKAGYEAWPTDVALLRHVRTAGLGRPSTIVGHVTTLMQRNLLALDGGRIALNDKGHQWLAHARQAGLSAQVSVAIESRLAAPIEDVHASARAILSEHGLLGQVDTAIARMTPTAPRAAPAAVMEP